MTDEEKAVFWAVASSVRKWELDHWETLSVTLETGTVVMKSPSGRVYAVFVEDVSNDRKPAGS